MSNLLMFAGFIAFVVAMLLVDLLVFHRRAHRVGPRESLRLAGFWVGLALLFNVGVYIFRGPHDAIRFFSGYLIEESLSVDNLFVFLMLFTYFRVPQEVRHKVLFWGIIGALGFRLSLILAGTALVHRFSWVLYVFGGILILSSIKLATQRDEGIEPERNVALKVLRRILPLTSSYEGSRFFVRRNGKWMGTPLLLVLGVVELTDLVFALDSIPAIFAVTTDPFIVFSSNAFAVLGLRSIFFALAGIMELFVYLRQGLAVLLGVIGVKMLVHHWIRVPIGITLLIIVLVLGTSIAASLLHARRRGGARAGAGAGGRRVAAGRPGEPGGADAGPAA